MRSDALVAGCCAANTNNIQSIQVRTSNTIDQSNGKAQAIIINQIKKPNTATATTTQNVKATTSSDYSGTQQVCSAAHQSICLGDTCLCQTIPNVWQTNAKGTSADKFRSNIRNKDCRTNQFVDVSLLAKCKSAAAHRVATMAKYRPQVAYNQMPSLIRRLPSSVSLSGSTKSTSDESKFGLSHSSQHIDSTSSSNPTATIASMGSPANSLVSSSKLSTSSAASSSSLGSTSSSLGSTSCLRRSQTIEARSRRRSYRVDMSDFDLLKVLGTGAYGKVFLVRKLNGHDKGKLYAMKVLNKEIVAQKTKTLDHTRTERKVLEAIRNEPFLVTMHYAFQTRSKLHLILDYVNGGELFTHLYQRDHFKEDDVRIYIGELVLALDKLHKVSLDRSVCCHMEGRELRLVMDAMSLGPRSRLGSGARIRLTRSAERCDIGSSERASEPSQRQRES